jgi:hypothetical protein
MHKRHPEDQPEETVGMPRSELLAANNMLRHDAQLQLMMYEQREDAIISAPALA